MWRPAKRSPSTWLTAAAARTMIQGARCVILLIASQAGTRTIVVQSRASEQIQIRPPDNTLTLSHCQLSSPPCDEVTAFSADLWRWRHRLLSCVPFSSLVAPFSFIFSCFHSFSILIFWHTCSVRNFLHSYSVCISERAKDDGYTLASVNCSSYLTQLCFTVAEKPTISASLSYVHQDIETLFSPAILQNGRYRYIPNVDVCGLRAGSAILSGSCSNCHLDLT